jgi:hypothetical protein
VGSLATVAVVLLPVLQGSAQRYAVAVIALATALGVPLAVAKAPRNAYPWSTVMPPELPPPAWPGSDYRSDSDR